MYDVNLFFFIIQLLFKTRNLIECFSDMTSALQKWFFLLSFVECLFCYICWTFLPIEQCRFFSSQINLYLCKYLSLFRVILLWNIAGLPDIKKKKNCTCLTDNFSFAFKVIITITIFYPPTKKIKLEQQQQEKKNTHISFIFVGITLDPVSCAKS